MRAFVLSMIATLVVAACVVLVHDRFRDPDPREALSRIEQRLLGLETRLGGPPAAPPSGAPAARTGDHGIVDVIEALKRVQERLTDLEGTLFDAERNLRSDLKGVYERLLDKMAQAPAAAPGSGETDPAAKAAFREKLKEMGIEISDEEGIIRVRGAIGNPKQGLELLAVAPGGRAHEALLVIDVVPSILKLALLDLGLKEVPDPDPETFAWPEDADGVYIYAIWEGLKKPRRIEDLVLNTQAGDAMQRCKWLFTGSRFYTDTRTWERQFSADLHKNLIAITTNHSTSCLLACPLKEAANQYIWMPSELTCPDPGTAMTIMFCKEPRAEWDKI